MQKSISTTEQFCLGLLGLPLSRPRALANFVMGLLSQHNAQHPVDAFLSPFCQYTHSNLGKVVEDLSADEAEWEAAAAEIQGFLQPYGPPVRQCEGLPYFAFALDATKVYKPHSPTLEGRQYVPKSNEVIRGNKGIDIGYPLSVLHWQGGAGWPLPWRSSMPGVGDNLVATGVKDAQLSLNDLSGTLGGSLCVLEADSSYGQAAFLSPLHPSENLVCIVRLRAGIRVWLPADDEGPTGGAKRVYGEKYYLSDTTVVKTFRQKPSERHPQGLCTEVGQRSIAELGVSEETQAPGTLKNGRKVTYHIKRWRNVMIRSKNGHNMKDKPFDVLRIEVRDEADGQLVFERPLFVAASGQRRDECSNLFVQQSYRERYEVEPFYNYFKHRLLLQHFLTCERQHLLNYLLLAQIATWALWCAHDECDLVCKPWQKYLPKNQAALPSPKEPVGAGLPEGETPRQAATQGFEGKTPRQAAAQGRPQTTGEKPKLTIAQTRQSINPLFSTFDLTPFKPPYYKKGKGRAKGAKLEPRKKSPVLRKVKKKPEHVKRE